MNWTLDFKEPNLILIAWQGEKEENAKKGVITNLEVAKEPYEDEYVSINCKGTDRAAICDLNKFETKSIFSMGIPYAHLTNAMDFVDMVKKMTTPSTSVVTAISKAAECLYGQHLPSEISTPPLESQDHVASPTMFDDDDDKETNFEIPGIDVLPLFESTAVQSPIYAPETSLSDDSSSANESFTQSTNSEVVQETSTVEDSFETCSKTRKRSRSCPSGRQKGLKKFKKDMEKGRVDLNGPKRYEGDWPPPFHKTVNNMREWLIQNSSQDENWDDQQRQMLRTYYSNIFGLDSRKSGTGNIYLYFKVALLSKRCWKLAKTIMTKLEDGSLLTGKKQRARRVFQTSFSCLSGLEPRKHEDAIFEILTKYLQGEFHLFIEIRQRHGIQAKKSIVGELAAAKYVNEDPSENGLNDNQNTIKKMAEVSKQLEKKRDEMKTCQLDNANLTKEKQKLLNQLKMVTEEKNKLARRCLEMEKTNMDLQKQLKLVREDLITFSAKQATKEKENEKLRNNVCTLKNELQKLTTKSSKKNEGPVTKCQLDQIKDRHRSNTKLLNEHKDSQVQNQNDEAWEEEAKDAKACHTAKGKATTLQANDKDDSNEKETEWDFDVAKVTINSWVAVAYDTYLSFGKVQSINPQGVLRINFLNNNPVDGFYTWPIKERLFDEDVKFVVKPDIKVIQHGKKYIIPDIDSLRKLYKEYKKKFM